VQLRRATDISDLESRMPQDDPFEVRAVSPTLSSAVAVKSGFGCGCFRTICKWCVRLVLGASAERPGGAKKQIRMMG
jgi:hypothetical protein